MLMSAMDDNQEFQFSHSELESLIRARVIYVATVRNDGTQSTAAPLWFTISSRHKILMQSGPGSWHVRRIRRGSPVLVWIGSRRGIAFIGAAEFSDDPMTVQEIVENFPKKYLMAWLGLHRPTRSSFASGGRVAIEITPLRLLPHGFRSQPGAPAPSLTGLRSSSIESK